VIAEKPLFAKFASAAPAARVATFAPPLIPTPVALPAKPDLNALAVPLILFTAPAALIALAPVNNPLAAAPTPKVATPITTSNTSD